MQITLNVLLYKLAANSIYETQNINLSDTFNSVKLFDLQSILSNTENASKKLYLVSTEQLLENESQLLSSAPYTNTIFFCICNDESIHIHDFCDSLPLVLLYTDCSFVEIFNKVLSIYQNFNNWNKDFHLALLRNHSMQELLDLSSHILSHPMVVLDSNFSLLGYFKNDSIQDPIMENILNAGYVTPQVMARLRQDGLISTSENAENPLINYYCLSTHDCYYSMMYRFLANNHVVGYALIFRNRMHPKTNYLYLMNMVADNLNLYFQQKRYSSRSSSEIYESILTEILENPTASEEQFKDQLSYVPGLSMNGAFMLARLTYTNISDLPHSFLCWNLRNSLASVKPFVYDNQVYVLKINSISENFNYFLTLEEETIFRDIFKNHEFVCAISNTFFSLMDLPIAITQCNETLKLNRSSTNPFLYFEDISLQYILHKLKKESIQLIESPHYHLLKQHDVKHNSDLCEVFMQYLKNGRNINQTSAAIFMHRNTVFNKVKKAASIMFTECEDYQSQITFILSYLADQK